MESALTKWLKRLSAAQLKQKHEYKIKLIACNLNNLAMNIKGIFIIKQIC
jgi:hypothetical protein